MVVSIHQPNYIPWIGYFNKIARSDVFVIYDDAQFPISKNHFGHRNQIRTNNGWMYLTLPIHNKISKLKFSEIQMTNLDWANSHINYIETFYKKTPYFKDYSDDLFNTMLSFCTEDRNDLLSLNVAIIDMICEWLKIPVTFVFSSTLNFPETGGEKILSILKQLGATEYISGEGTGSMRYINPEDFEAAGIKLTWQKFKHPVYKQRFEPFMENMSIIDMLFNCGREESKKLLINEI